MITLSTLPDATAQEVFDQMLDHLRKQGKKSEIHGYYLYRCEINGEVLRCPAGCFITDEEYKIQMDDPKEGSEWMDLVERKLVPSHHCGLIQAGQRIHDAYEPHEWENQFILLAYKKGLIC